MICTIIKCKTISLSVGQKRLGGDDISLLDIEKHDPDSEQIFLPKRPEGDHMYLSEPSILFVLFCLIN